MKEDGTFEFPMQAKHGQNVSEATALDPFGNETAIVQSYHFSTVYNLLDNENTAASVIKESVKLYLDDLLFYNQDPEDDHNLSALVKNMLADLDLEEFLPNPLATQQILLCPYEINIYDLSFGEPDVRLAPEEGSIGFHVSINDFFAHFTADGDNWSCLPLDGDIVAEAIMLDASLVITVTPDGLLDIRLESVAVNFLGLELVMDDWVDWLADLIVTSMTSMIEEEVEKLLTQLAADLTENLLVTLAQPIEIPIDAIPGTDQVLLEVTVRFEYVDIQPPGVDIAANIAVTADKRIGLDSLGALGYANCLGEPPTGPLFDEFFPEKIEAGVYLDLVNQALNALWLNGGLNLAIDSETLAELGTDVSAFGLGNLMITTEPLLPPVITDCNPAGALTTQIGDFYMEADFELLGKPVDLHVFLFLEIEVEFAVVDGAEGKEISITIHSPTLSKLQIAYLNEEWEGNEQVFEDLFLDTIIPLIFDQLAAEPITIAIPSFNLADLNTSEAGTPSPIELPELELIIDLQELKMSMGYLLGRTGVLFETP
jgi:hypothetical protein